MQAPETASWKTEIWRNYWATAKGGKIDNIVTGGEKTGLVALLALQVEAMQGENSHILRNTSKI